MYKLIIRKLGLLIIFGLLYLPMNGQKKKIVINYNGVQGGPREELFPNPAGDALETPSGFGSTIPFAYGYLGGTFPAAYSKKSDMIASVGFGLGNSYKNVGVVAALNMIDVSKARNFSGSFGLYRYLGDATSLSIGGMNLFASKDPKYVNDGASYYAVISHASQTIKSKTPGYSALTYGIGVGTGVFFLKTVKDSISGKGERGTLLFVNIAYEVLKGVNVITEWNGVNLSVGVGIRPSFKWPALSIGVADLTTFSGDGPRLIVGLAHSLAFSKH
jgi:hypothetical protein